MVTKSCLKCEKEFVTEFNRKSYCSEECRRGVFRCLFCTSVFLKSKNSLGLFCSLACNYKSKENKEIEYVKCTNCKLEKSKQEFPFGGGLGGIHTWCRSCHANKFQEKKCSKQEIEKELFRNSQLENFAENLKIAREAANLTKTDLAKKIGVVQPRIIQYETGRALPSQKTLLAIFNVFGWKIPISLQSKGKEYRLPIGIEKCLHCNNEFTKYRANTHFCSRVCSAVYKNKKDAKYEYKTNSGYVKIKTNDIWMFEHRHVMEKHLGRKLLGHENVHHKDGDKLNNDISNLELWSKSQPAGQRVEDKLEWARKMLEEYKDYEVK